MSVVIETTAGDFTVDLYIEERPQACKNFLKLCKIKYYNFCLFHSIQHNFIAQTGDPTGSGKNGESVYSKIFGEERKFFEAEIVPKMKHSKAGLLSMVNCGDNMLGSQFFLTLSSELQSLDGEHCVFGEVAEGTEILLKLNEVICDNEHRPYQDIRITHTVILEDPFDDPPGLVVPDGSPEPSKETLLNGRIAADEDLDESKGLTPQELEEMVRQREAQAQATILEIVGDLPDADMAPPENVLFVCKLNPVTSDDDLEIIFSRFGKVKSCEVIRDKNTGDSLQYAFVEFEEQKSCEDAFFKMDNVLIDDRRIHVDFSQSVSKMKWKGKGRGVEHFNEDKSSNRHKNAPRNDERMPPPKGHKNKMVDGDRANGRHDNSSKSRHQTRDQQSRQDPDRNKYNSNENSSRREKHDDRQNMKDGSRGHHRDGPVERERVDREEGRRGGRDERNQQREKLHGRDESGRRERDNTGDRYRSDRVRENRNDTRERSRHDERNREERRERTYREDRTREEGYKVDRHHQDNREREDRRDKGHRDERLERGKHSRDEGREESRHSDSYNNKGRDRDTSRNDKKPSREEHESSNIKKEFAVSKGCDSKKRPREEPEKKKMTVKKNKMPEKTKKVSNQKSSKKKRRSVSSSSSDSSSSSGSSSSSSSGSDSESSDTSTEKRKTKSKESDRKKAKMVKIKSKSSSTKLK